MTRGHLLPLGSRAERCRHGSGWVGGREPLAAGCGRHKSLAGDAGTAWARDRVGLTLLCLHGLWALLALPAARRLPHRVRYTLFSVLSAPGAGLVTGTASRQRPRAAARRHAAAAAGTGDACARDPAAADVATELGAGRRRGRRRRRLLARRRRAACRPGHCSRPAALHVGRATITRGGHAPGQLLRQCEAVGPRAAAAPRVGAAESRSCAVLLLALLVVTHLENVRAVQGVRPGCAVWLGVSQGRHAASQSLSAGASQPL